MISCFVIDDDLRVNIGRQKSETFRLLDQEAQYASKVYVELLLGRYE